MDTTQIYFDRIVKGTEQAVLIECLNRTQVWVPRSAIISLDREYQEATVANWFTQKNPDLTAPANRQRRKPRFAHYYAH